LDGSRYEGNFEDNKKKGLGAYQSHLGEKYEGEWVNDQYHGEGKLILPDGTIYQGIFEEGQRQGEGTLFVTKKKGEYQYKGEWSNGLLGGTITRTNPNNRITHPKWSKPRDIEEIKKKK